MSISVAVATLMTAAALLLLRDVRALERRLRDAVAAPAATANAPVQPALEAKTRFLATVSHEMRTPMNGVLGMADLLAATRIDAEQRTYIEAIKTSGEALLTLIDEILDFSKIDAGKLDLTAEAFEVASACEAVAELLAPRAHGKGIEIAVFVAPDVPLTITSDPARFRQVLINLAGNAIKFTESGGVGIRVDMARPGRLAVTLSDTGVGIAADRLEAIFEDFEQADGSSSRQFGGTGLGLSISRRIIQGLGGEISVESTPGQGSRFRVELPAEPASRQTQQDQDGWQGLTGKRFLLVAQSRFEAPYLADYLVAAGAATMRAEDAEAACRAIRTERGLDGVIVDCSLGEREARQVAETAAGALIPHRFILLSPYERRSLGPPGAAGFNGYLIKPLRGRSLFARLRDEPAGQGEIEKPAQSPGHVHMGLKVLLAEDNDINALLAMRLLQRYGCDAAWVTDGHAAVAAFEKAAQEGHPFDAALLDIRMPGIDGLEAARHIRSHEQAGRLQPTRLIALTANAFAADQRACLEAGFDSFVAKPLTQSRLIRALSETLGDRDRVPKRA